MAAPGLPPAVQRMLPAFGDEPVWLVGGAVRDLLLGRPSNDFDFVVQGDGLALGRRLANALGADYYDLDPSRSTGRLILTTEEGRKSTFDFASLRGRDLAEDLARRDFTVNAMAIALGRASFRPRRASHPVEGRASHPVEGRASHPEENTLEGQVSPEGDPPVGETPHRALIDPLGGSQDLRDKRLRPCSATSVADDPIRAVRAVRLAVDFGFSLEATTTAQIRRVGGDLSSVSPERMRDEFFRLLESDEAAAGLRLLDRLGLLAEILPEIEPLRGVAQPLSHAYDVFDHSLATAGHLAKLARLLAGRSGRTEARDLTEASALVQLGPFQDALAAYLDFAPSYGRSRRSLLLWTALLHDSGKERSRAVDHAGRIRFFGHETVGSRIAVDAGRRLRLSTVEQAEVEMTVLHHMRPEWLEAEGEPTRRAIYRFFRAVESTGPSVILLSLADLQARYLPPIPPEVWQRRLTVVGELMRAWFERPAEVIAPAPLLTGDEIMSLGGLRPGPEVGRIIESLREAQAGGEVSTREEAEEYVRRMGGS